MPQTQNSGQALKRGLLVEHPIANPFASVRFYVTLSKGGLALLHHYWSEIARGKHGDIAMCLCLGWDLPERPDHRIREARFEHDLQVQNALMRSFHAGTPIQSIRLADDLERVQLAKRPAKIPDIVIAFQSSDGESKSTTATILWGEVEYSRKNAREVDLFCAYYRGALAGTSERKFDKLIVLCHESVLAQWRRDFCRTVVPQWRFRQSTRDWVRLDAKDWHRFPDISAVDVEAIIKPL